MEKSKILYKRALTTCVVMFLVCIIFKLFGATWLNLNTNIPLLNKLDGIIMNDPVLSFMYSFILTMINGYLICILINKSLKVNIKRLIIVSVIAIFISRNCITIQDRIFKFIFDIFCFIYVTGYKGIIEYLLVIIINSGAQLLSLYIRDLTIAPGSYNLVTSILLNMDYYILMIFMYLTLVKEDMTLCSITQASFSSLASKLWKKHSENYLNKGVK